MSWISSLVFLPLGSSLLLLPVLSPVPDMHDLDDLVAESIDEDIGCVTHYPFASAGMRSRAAEVRLVRQKPGRLDDPLGHRTGGFRILLKVAGLAGL